MEKRRDVHPGYADHGHGRQVLRRLLVGEGVGEGKAKKDKYLDACLERRKSFTPLVYSVNGMACKEARAFEKRVASLLALKWEQRYSKMVGFVRAWMSLAIIRSNTHLLRGARTSRPQRLSMEDGAAMSGHGPRPQGLDARERTSQSTSW